MFRERPLPDLALAQSKASLSPRALRAGYLAALVMVAALTVAGQALFQYNLHDDQGYSRTIDLAGRQRMLVMGMARHAQALALGADPGFRSLCRAGLAQNLQTWQGTNAIFLSGEGAEGLKPGGPAIRRAWEELAPLISDVTAAAERLARPAAGADAAPADETEAARRLPALADRYLPAMDALVKLYDEESRERARQLQTLGLLLAGLVLALLLVEGLFIFRPITRRISCDMFNLAALALQMRDLSLKDGLTGVFNRRHFDEQMDREWRRAAREDQTLALLLMDIDHFKAFNDIYGHLAGDQALKAVADAAGRELHRPGDLLARYGGEEFAVVLPQTGLTGALLLAENIRAAVKALAIPNAGSTSGPLLTVSLGVAVARPSREEGPQGLVEAADQALYRAKQAGRDRVDGPPGGAAEDWS